MFIHFFCMQMIIGANCFFFPSSFFSSFRSGESHCRALSLSLIVYQIRKPFTTITQNHRPLSLQSCVCVIEYLACFLIPTGPLLCHAHTHTMRAKLSTFSQHILQADANHSFHRDYVNAFLKINNSREKTWSIQIETIYLNCIQKREKKCKDLSI